MWEMIEIAAGAPLYLAAFWGKPAKEATKSRRDDRTIA
jgi:hypothetical protein